MNYEYLMVLLLQLLMNYEYPYNGRKLEHI